MDPLIYANSHGKTWNGHVGVCLCLCDNIADNLGASSKLGFFVTFY